MLRSDPQSMSVWPKSDLHICEEKKRSGALSPASSLSEYANTPSAPALREGLV